MEGREAALTDSVADRLRRLVTGEDSKSALLGRRFGTDGRSEVRAQLCVEFARSLVSFSI